jgi:hypothetical protein
MRIDIVDLPANSSIADGKSQMFVTASRFSTAMIRPRPLAPSASWYSNGTITIAPAQELRWGANGRYPLI